MTDEMKKKVEKARLYREPTSKVGLILKWIY